MSGPKKGWIDLAQELPEPDQFVRVEVRERVESHWIEYEGQARFSPERGWLSADGEPYLSDEQEIVYWRPLLDGSSKRDWGDLIGGLSKE